MIPLSFKIDGVKTIQEQNKRSYILMAPVRKSTTKSAMNAAKNQTEKSNDQKSDPVTFADSLRVTFFPFLLGIYIKHMDEQSLCQ